MTQYSREYLQHFSAPQNVGEIESADASVEVDHRGGGCFDRVRFTVKVEGDRIERMMFKARACSGTIAASSAATAWAAGKTLEEAERLDAAVLDNELGGVPEKKRHSIELAARAVQEVVEKFRTRKG